MSKLYEVKKVRIVEHGYSTLQFAALLPVLAVLLVGGIDISRVLQARGVMRQAATIGLRCLTPAQGDCRGDTSATRYQWQRQVLRDEYEEQLYRYGADEQVIVGPERRYESFTAEVLSDIQITRLASVPPALVGGTNEYQYSFFEQVAPLPVLSRANAGGGIRDWRNPRIRYRWQTETPGVVETTLGRQAVLSDTSTEYVTSVFTMPTLPIPGSACVRRCEAGVCEPCSVDRVSPIVLHVQGEHVRGALTLGLDYQITGAEMTRNGLSSSRWISLGGQQLQEQDRGEASFIPRGASRWQHNVEELPEEAQQAYNRSLRLASGQRLWLRLRVLRASADAQWRGGRAVVYYPRFLYRPNHTEECEWNRELSHCDLPEESFLSKNLDLLAIGITDIPTTPERVCENGAALDATGGCGRAPRQEAPVECAANKGVPPSGTAQGHSFSRLWSVCQPGKPEPTGVIAHEVSTASLEVPVSAVRRGTSCKQVQEGGLELNTSAYQGYQNVTEAMFTEARYTLNSDQNSTPVLCDENEGTPAEALRCEQFTVRTRPLVASSSESFLAKEQPGSCNWQQQVVASIVAEGLANSGTRCVTPYATPSGSRTSYVKPPACGNVEVLDVRVDTAGGWENVAVTSDSRLVPAACRSVVQRCERLYPEDAAARKACEQELPQSRCRKRLLEQGEAGELLFDRAKLLAARHMQTVAPWMFPRCNHEALAVGLCTENGTIDLDRCDGAKCPEIDFDALERPAENRTAIEMGVQLNVALLSKRLWDSVAGGDETGAGVVRLRYQQEALREDL